MKLQFWGAAGTVTGSMHLVEVGGRRLLIDCGLQQGLRKQSFEANRNLPFDAASIDAVIVTHAHIDHTGNLPTLVRQGFNGQIFATDATRDLASYMLLDSARIQVNDVAYVNRQRRRDGRRLFEPLYEEVDAASAVRRFVAIPYSQDFEPLPGVTARFVDAGHMLGSASVRVELNEQGARRVLCFSGDIGHSGAPIIREPEIVRGAEVLVMESTYGDRRHSPAADTRRILIDAARETLAQRGTLLIPSFAVGRTQEIVYRLNELSNAGELPALPVYVDSPLAVNVTDVYRRHPECYDDEALQLLLSEQDKDPFGFQSLQYVRSVEESKRLNELPGPAIIVSASGMCEGGRVLHHLKHRIEQPSTTILFVGYQAEHTLGRRILDGAPIVPILGRDYHVRAKILRADGCSAHADCDELKSWATRTQQQGKLDHVFLVHGEATPAQTLVQSLTAAGLPNVSVATRGQIFQL